MYSRAVNVADFTSVSSDLQSFTYMTLSGVGCKLLPTHTYLGSTSQFIVSAADA